MNLRRAFLALGAVLLVAGVIGGYWYVRWSGSPAAVEASQFVDSASDLPSAEEFARLAQTDPVRMLSVCLSRYTREANGFRGTLEKQEQVNGTAHPAEVIKVSVREKPVAVAMRWVSGARPDIFGIRTVGVAYREEDADGLMQTWRPEARIFRERRLDPKDRMFARTAARYCITEAGLLPTMLRTYDAWSQHQQTGELRFTYHGVQQVAKLNDRPCHVIERQCPRREVDSFARNEAPPTDPKVIERDGYDRVTIYIDSELWLQTGTVLRQSDGTLIGAYYFRDLELNPSFLPDEFTLEGLKRPVE